MRPLSRSLVVAALITIGINVSLGLVAVIAGLWNAEHTLMQRYGVQRIYGRKLYDIEQLQVAELVMDQLDRIYPGLRAQIEVVDVATPLSYERYTGNWLGSSCGWLLTKETMAMMIKLITCENTG